MYLKRLELQGFKTFAKKTTLSFLGPKDAHHAVTAIVGPNGSGKSNLADAIRWVLGEQSMKLLRGKSSEDIIFSGSEGRARSGFSEVAVTFDNTDKSMPLETSEVTITRRLYRDGQSEYLVNNTATRLTDIKLMLAEANVGQRSYSVIGQGMVDHILVSSPEERKAFFDDATGVKQFQLKRHEAMLKLKRTYENLSEVEMLLSEIEPRLRSLKRQVRRLEQREEVETELRKLERQYYGTLWWKLQDELGGCRERFDRFDKNVAEKRSSLSSMEARVAEMEKQEEKKDDKDEGLLLLQKQYQQKQRERGKLRDEHFSTQKTIELEKVRAQSTWSPLPLNKIIDEIEGITQDQTSLLERVRQIKAMEELEALTSTIDTVLGRSKKLLGRLQRPSPEDVETDPKLLKKIEDLKNQQKTVEKELRDLEQQMKNYAAKEKKVRTELFDLQRELRTKQQEIHLLENKRNSVNIDLARLEEREANLKREMQEQVKDLVQDIQGKRPSSLANTSALHPEIQRLRYKLELIGGIDPEIVQEYEETKTRYEFLDEQVSDLRKAITSTEKVVDELDEEIRKQSEQAFKEINKQFQHFFKILFGGGSCSLIKLTKEDLTDEVEVSPDRVSVDTTEAERKRHEEDTSIDAVKQRIKEREDRIIGIDIQATPPGKRMKALNLLSGGERALTSIALVSAIMAVNPGPFVVLDEVDAALDEANTMRFANILGELRKLTQFVIITHNRATMEQADVLYGVTMGEDGISHMLSVNLEDIQEAGTARR